MSNNLRDRIAAVQAQHRSTIVSAHGLVECSCKPGWRLSTITDHDLHVADAVIAALATTYISREAMLTEIQSYAEDHEDLDLADSAQDLIDTAAEWDQWK